MKIKEETVEDNSKDKGEKKMERIEKITQKEAKKISDSEASSKNEEIPLIPLMLSIKLNHF